MRLEIFKKQNAEEKKVELRLSKWVEGVSVGACVDGVHKGYIVTLKENGTLYFHTGVDKELGFQLDNAGRVKWELE